MSTDCTPTAERFSGFADLYDRYRPAPPPAVAVREAVGPDMALMLNPFHYYSYYSREEALALGRGLEKLNSYWMEEPMDEHSTASYVWPTEQLDLPICGSETAEGKMQTRAEWIVRDAADISRGDVGDLGGITPLMKVAHLAESFGMTRNVMSCPQACQFR